MTASAAATWLRAKDWAEVSLVLLVEGYDIGWVSHSDVAGLSSAWSSASGGTRTNLVGGLEVGGTIARDVRIMNAECRPSSMSFAVHDVDDQAISLMFSESLSTIKRTRLSESVDAFALSIQGIEHAGFPIAGYAYIGTETVAYLGGDNVFATGSGGRGQFTLHGTYRGTAFAQRHEVDSETDARPLITDRPVNWVNRRVGLYLCHYANGAWSAGFPGSNSNDAELLWAGRIKSWRDEGDGRITIDCIDTFDDLKVTLGATAFQAELQEGLEITAGMNEYSTDATMFDSDVGNPPITHYDGFTIATWTTTGQYMTHSEVASALNTALFLRTLGSPGTYLPLGAFVSMVRNQEGKYEVRVTWPTIASTQGLKVGLWLPERIWDLLGFHGNLLPAESQSSGTANNILLFRKEVTLNVGQTSAAFVAEDLPRKYILSPLPLITASEGSKLRVTSVVNGTEYVAQPTSTIPGVFPSDTTGFLLIDGKFLLAVKQEDATTFTLTASATQYFTGEDPQKTWESVSNTRDGDSGAAITVRQVWLEAGSIGTIFLKLLASTGTAEYNHPTYDAYPSWLSVGVPWELIDWQSILGMGDDAYLLLVKEPTPFLKLFESALNFGARHCVWKDGKLTIVTTGEAAAGTSTLVALTEDNKAKRIDKDGARQQVVERTTCDRNPDGIINRATLKYNADLGGKFLKQAVVNAVASQSDTKQPRGISLDAWGIYEDFGLLPGGSVSTWATNVVATSLAYFSRPLGIAERSFDFSLATQLTPGTRCTLTDDYLVDPTTGTRGVSGLLCWVVSTSFDWATGVGKVRVVFQPENATTDDGDVTRLGLWAPSAMVDRDYRGGAAVGDNGTSHAGLETDAYTVVHYKFNETSAPGTGYATAVDAASGARDLTETNTTGYTYIVNGPAGHSSGSYARWFPGLSATYLSRNGDATCRTTFLASWSCEFWIRTVSGTSDGNIWNYGGTTDNQADNDLATVRLTSGAIDLFWEHGAGVNVVTTPTGMSLTPGTWYHIGVTVDNSGGTATARFYKSGTLQDTKTGLTKADGGTNTAGFLRVGRGGTGARFTIKDLRISSIKRSDAEIAASAAAADYQHALDADTFILWRFNEAPDVFDEVDYGYHARCTSGVVNDVVTALLADGGKARHVDGGTTYFTHQYYQPFLDMLAGNWTWEGFVKFDAGWRVRDNMWFWGWNAGNDDSSSTANNTAVTTGNANTGKLTVLSEYDTGTDANFTTETIWGTDAEGTVAHYLAVVHYTSGGQHFLKVYLDGSLFQASPAVGVGANYWSNGENGSLFVSWNGVIHELPPVTMDEYRWSNVARSASEIAAAWGSWAGGYNPNTKQLRLLPHQYSAEADPIDLSNFEVGDNVHIVELSPAQPTAPLEWIDTIAAIDTQNSIATLTNGLDSTFDATKYYVLEFDDVQTVTTDQLQNAFIADADTRTTGLADNDAYLWSGEPEAAPDEVYVTTQRYRKVVSTADDQGEPFSVHKLNDISRFIQSALIWHTAPVYVNQPLTQAVTYGSGTTYRIVFGPLYVPFYYGNTRELEVRLLAASTGSAATVYWRAAVSHLLPTSSGGNADFDNAVFADVRADTLNWVQLSTSSSSYTWITGRITRPEALPGYPSSGWFTVEATAAGGGGTAGLKHVYLAEATDTLAAPDIRQDTSFISPSANQPPLAAWARRARFPEAPFASTGRRQRGYT